MKKLFLSLVALIATTMSFAQSTLVATLSHGSNITMYYGTYALRDAYNAAVSGDIINLSGGSFQAVDIKKAVTLRGVGIDNANPTYIMSNFTIEIPSDDANRFSMEGIQCANYITMNGSFTNAYFLKCQIQRVTCQGSVKNTLFANCKVVNSYFDVDGTCTVQIINSLVSHFQVRDNAAATVVNSIIIPMNNFEAHSIKNSQLINCIVFNNSRSYGKGLASTTTATNCVSLGLEQTLACPLTNPSTCQNCSQAKMDEVLVDLTNYELTDVAKTKYLGNDGTEVGLYGGIMPYTSTPSYPQITKMKVANKTTADGKLSVEIEVSAAQ